MAGKGLPGPRRLIIHLSLSFLILLTASSSSSILAATPTEAEALLEFKATLSANGGEGALQSWTQGSSPCSVDHSTWAGVYCVNGMVWALQLEHMRLTGHLNVTPLANLPSLRAFSVMDNDFVGPMPDISQIGALKALYLANNQFSGEIPDDAFARTRSLKKVFIFNNEFTGKLPSSLSGLTKLLFLRLDSNDFEGPIPDLDRAANLKLVNVSYNKLSGQIPESVGKMDARFFAGNEDLCGHPLKECPTEKKSNAKLIAIIIGCVFAVLIIAILIILLLCRRRRKVKDSTSGDAATEISSTAKSVVDVDKLEQGAGAYAAVGSSGHGGGGKKSSRDPEHGKLSFVKENEKERFELQDLLKASAEVLGSGNFGSSYKAVLVEGPSVVVKRFKEMNRVGREEFQEHMRRMGRLSHPNVLPLVAYYYRKEEKLLITRYIINGSLAHMLHGNRGSNLPLLEWGTRLKIIKGVARGLAYLYEELPMLTLPHGHLKSSNVLINDSYEALLTDYALVPVVNQLHASQVLVAYKAPEVTATGKPSKKSDVWSLGILILEVLTGKFPATYLQKGKGSGDLTEWVDSVVKEEEFDTDMKETATKSGQWQMSKMLKIGLACCEANVDKRWEMKQALDKIEELKEMEEEDSSNSVLMSSSLLSEVELMSPTKR